ncbi:MAG: spermidine dehydrogenase, partial [Gammaproteobacteria bacterium]|nr:spermidine dehydrogenase [Gammaproteobacteria bacterium]
MTKQPYDERDRALGMDRPITRRDFLNGVAVGAGAAVGAGLAAPGSLFAAALPDAAAPLSAAAQDAYGYYPPLLTGLRGSHAGSFEDAHALRDSETWPAPTDTG